MKQKIALVAGGTGLVGNLLARNLLKDDDFSHVIALGRREIPIASPKLTNKIVDFSQPIYYQDVNKADIAFCCLGTTMKKAGSNSGYYRVDYEYVYAFAQYALKLGCQQFHLVSGLGANRKSVFFYSRLKGEIEEAIAKLGFDVVHIMRPSLLLGDRQEKGFGEKIGIIIDRYFAFLIPSKYRGVQAASVANYMQRIAKIPSQQRYIIHESERIRIKGQ